MTVAPPLVVERPRPEHPEPGAMTVHSPPPPPERVEPSPGTPAPRTGEFTPDPAP